MEDIIIHAHKNNLKDISHIFENLELHHIGEGIFNKVFKVKNQDWVVKVGKWEISKSLLPMEFAENDLYIKLDEFFDSYLTEILPRPEFYKKQYEEYLILATYFGYSQDLHHLEYLGDKQKEKRINFAESFDEIQGRYNLEVRSLRKSRILDNYLNYNFLPKEYSFYGIGLHDKETSHIFQEFISGEALGEVKSLSQAQKDLLTLFLLLVLYLDLKEGYMVDLRPKGFVISPALWVKKTSNIIVNDNDVKFIDTRWVWDRNAKNIYRNNMFIFQTLILSIRYMLNQLE